MKTIETQSDQIFEEDDVLKRAESLQDKKILFKETVEDVASDYSLKLSEIDNQEHNDARLQQIERGDDYDEMGEDYQDIIDDYEYMRDKLTNEFKHTVREEAKNVFKGSSGNLIANETISEYDLS
jgi:hypothetical protein